MPERFGPQQSLEGISPRRYRRPCHSAPAWCERRQPYSGNPADEQAAYVESPRAGLIVDVVRGLDSPRMQRIGEGSQSVQFPTSGAGTMNSDLKYDKSHYPWDLRTLSGEHG